MNNITTILRFALLALLSIIGLAHPESAQALTPSNKGGQDIIITGSGHVIGGTYTSVRTFRVAAALTLKGRKFDGACDHQATVDAQNIGFAVPIAQPKKQSMLGDERKETPAVIHSPRQSIYLRRGFFRCEPSNFPFN